jgi:hypothetical protein
VSSNLYNGVNQEDMSFGSPMGDCRDNGGLYLTGYYKVPTAADTPHLGITMLNPTVAPEGKMLESELKAAVACLWAQTRSKQFTDHHTKPVRKTFPLPPSAPIQLTNHRVPYRSSSSPSNQKPTPVLPRPI